mgnify:CR=1 FL=1
MGGRGVKASGLGVGPDGRDGVGRRLERGNKAGMRPREVRVEVVG